MKQSKRKGCGLWWWVVVAGGDWRAMLGEAGRK
jgi:hypothetical protein